MVLTIDAYSQQIKEQHIPFVLVPIISDITLGLFSDHGRKSALSLHAAPSQINPRKNTDLCWAGFYLSEFAMSGG